MKRGAWIVFLMRSDAARLAAKVAAKKAAAEAGEVTGKDKKKNSKYPLLASCHP